MRWGAGYGDLTPLPPAPEERQVAEGPVRDGQTINRAAVPVEALDERRLGFSTRRPGQGRKDFECKPPRFSHPVEEVLLRDSHPRQKPGAFHRTRPALFILNPPPFHRIESGLQGCGARRSAIPRPVIPEIFMNNLLSMLARHGYALIFVVLFAEAVGLPFPAAIALIAAGAAVASHALSGTGILAAGMIALMVGDIVQFWLGRYTGWALLGFLCRVSMNPETCMLRSAESFYKRGKITLIIAKFIPGHQHHGRAIGRQHEDAVQPIPAARLRRGVALHPYLSSCRISVPRFPRGHAEELLRGRARYGNGHSRRCGAVCALPDRAVP